MATVTDTCPSCGNPAEIYIGQAIGFDDQLVWSEAIKCSSCGYTIEADDRGFPPEHYRDAILGQDGLWSVNIADPTMVKPTALVLKDALGLDRAAALHLAKAVPGEIWKGSAAEAEWLRRQLARRAVVATCQPSKKND